MSLDRCFDALRFLARSSELEATRLMEAELRIRDYLSTVSPTSTAQRAALEELDNAVIRESELRPQYASSFWRRIRDYIAEHLATLGDD
jgi:hypothetical protein